MSDILETVVIYRNDEPVLINKSDLKDTDKLKQSEARIKAEAKKESKQVK